MYTNYPLAIFLVIFAISIIFIIYHSFSGNNRNEAESGYKETLKGEVKPNMNKFMDSMGYNKVNNMKIPNRNIRKTLSLPTLSTAEATEQTKINQISNDIDDIFDNVLKNGQIEALENHISNFDDQDDSDDLHENNFSSNDFM
ncbi:hypothetical protein LRP52_29255 [Photobacterium sp. ZSDE20]|uniref:Uncharacterized protein n=1 Tax=Photobacterium pectinilyticum TaxID=2906793 RepID=A0ABT1N9A5_9GAMM|nr:hypothetical protein [Photobacterium sp. ZSDE20]MCQ1060281.1 hypothetical protein [Photobacterium sp. ZSDE20]MDD1826268.1 hypothetical protein [Photobacterium sp. ZSDE20]